MKDEENDLRNDPEYQAELKQMTSEIVGRANLPANPNLDPTTKVPKFVGDLANEQREVATKTAYEVLREHTGNLTPEAEDEIASVLVNSVLSMTYGSGKGPTMPAQLYEGNKIFEKKLQRNDAEERAKAFDHILAGLVADYLTSGQMFRYLQGKNSSPDDYKQFNDSKIRNDEMLLRIIELIERIKTLPGSFKIGHIKECKQLNISQLQQVKNESSTSETEH